MQENLCKISSCTGHNLLSDDSDKSIQLFFGGIFAQRNSERTIDNLGRNLHSIQNMTAVPLGAGRTGADTDAMILKNVDGILSGNAGNSNVQNMGCGMRTIQVNTRQGRQLFCQIIQKFVLFFDIFPEGSGSCSAGSGKADLNTSITMQTLLRMKES